MNMSFGFAHSMLILWLVSLSGPTVAITATTGKCDDSSRECKILNKGHYDYIVVGAGPSGVQMAQHLFASNEDFLVLERNSIPGSFFDKFPRHDYLLSINKKYTGTLHNEFNARHDWNSILAMYEHQAGCRSDQFRTNMDYTDLSVRDYSDDYYPSRKAVVDYLADYVDRFHLRDNILFNATVTKIQKSKLKSDSDGFEVAVTRGGKKMTLTSRVVFVATGVWRPHIPTNIEGIDKTIGYEEMSVNVSDYINKRLAIIGGKNSAFETAQFVSRATAVTHVLMNDLPHFAFESHYVGDLRSINMEFIDHYMLKSLDGLTEQDDPEQSSWKITYNETTQQYTIDPTEYRNSLDVQRAYSFRDDYDMIIRCTGFEFDHTLVQDESLPKSESCRDGAAKYPCMSTKYEINGQKNLYILGTAMHQVDFRKAAGGFIHGFRYLVRAVFNGAVAKYKHNRISISHDAIAQHILVRINTASSFYQMFGFMADIIWVGDSNVYYFYDMLISQVNEISSAVPEESVCTNVFLVTLAYHKDFHGFTKVWTRERVHLDYRTAQHSNFLHPVLFKLNCRVMHDENINWDLGFLQEYVVSTRHVMEDFLTRWDDMLTHRRWLVKWVRDATGVEQNMNMSVPLATQLDNAYC